MYAVDNIARKYGGGVYLAYRNLLNIIESTISRELFCQVACYAFHLNSQFFDSIMCVVENIAQKHGAGVYLAPDSSLNMNGSTISSRFVL